MEKTTNSQDGKLSFVWVAQSTEIFWFTTQNQSLLYILWKRLGSLEHLQSIIIVVNYNLCLVPNVWLITHIVIWSSCMLKSFPLCLVIMRARTDANNSLKLWITKTDTGTKMFVQAFQLIVQILYYYVLYIIV